MCFLLGKSGIDGSSWSKILGLTKPNTLIITLQGLLFVRRSLRTSLRNIARLSRFYPTKNVFCKFKTLMTNSRCWRPIQSIEKVTALSPTSLVAYITCRQHHNEMLRYYGEEKTIHFENSNGTITSNYNHYNAKMVSIKENPFVVGSGSVDRFLVDDPKLKNVQIVMFGRIQWFA